MRRVLIIGGTTFMGHQLVWRLVSLGWQVTILNRGHHVDAFGPRVERIVADRRSAAFAEALAGRYFEAVVDLAAYNGRDAEGVVAALGGRTDHYIFISSGAAYLVREGIELPVPRALREEDYPGPMSIPPGVPEDLPSWRYGAAKREAEEVLAAAWRETRFPSTRIRLPIVNGLRDPDRRLESYLWRLSDGGPVIIPDEGQQLTRHVYVTDVVNAIAGFIANPSSLGEAYNLSQDEDLSLADLVQYLANSLGVPDRRVSMSSAMIKEAGLEVRLLSPFSGKWASRLDASRAKKAWGFSHRPLTQYLDAMVDAYLAQSVMAPPPAYSARAQEIALANKA